MKYGMLTFIRDVEPNRFLKHPAPTALYRCDCGREKKIRVRDVISGRSRSCGCVAKRAMYGQINAFAKEHMAAKKRREAVMAERKAGENR